MVCGEFVVARGDGYYIVRQLQDDGRLNGSKGQTVDFSHTVVIMPSDLGASHILAATTAGQPLDSIREWLMQQLRERFRPEFLNRIDEIIVFHGLETAQLRQITELLLEQTRRRLRAQDITLDVSEAAVDWLAKNGYQPEVSARPLPRTVQPRPDKRRPGKLLDV